MRSLRWIVMAGLLAILLAGCGTVGVQDYLEGNYSLYDVQPNTYNPRDEARVYESEDPVPDVAAAIAAAHPPESMTEPPRDDRMVLVYPEEIVDVAAEEGRTLVTWSSQQYVRDNYGDSNIFEGLLAAAIISDIFSGPRSRGWGYPAGPLAPAPTGGSVREGSVGGPTVRGGGLSAGK